MASPTTVLSMIVFQLEAKPPGRLFMGSIGGTGFSQTVCSSVEIMIRKLKKKSGDVFFYIYLHNVLLLFEVKSTNKRNKLYPGVCQLEHMHIGMSALSECYICGCFILPQTNKTGLVTILGNHQGLFTFNGKRLKRNCATQNSKKQ